MDTSKYIEFPNFDQVIFPIYGPMALRWYSLAYIAGIVIGWFYLKFILKKYKPSQFSIKHLDDIVSWAVIGIILGGRIGHILFYDFMHYVHNPMKILRVWEGGMSFHGGLLGVVLSSFFFSRRYKVSFLQIIDLMALAAPIGLGLGRVANFINGEVFGRVTDVPWAVLFPAGGYLPRHPSQLYEAFLEGIVLFIIVNWLTLGKNKFNANGYASGVFLIGYGVFRIVIEFFREPDSNLGYFFEYIPMGQIVSLPLLGFGLFLIHKSKKT
jgi:phosphatidylglycerol:prolipoprotein diacylglycerol transferase